MNILLVSGPGISLKEPYNSGIEAFMVSFANQLVEKGHAVDVVANDADASAKFTVVNPFNASNTAEPDFLQGLKEKREFSNLDVSPYDLIHYNMFYPHLLQAGVHFNKTSFLTLHSPPEQKRITAYKNLLQESDITLVAVSERIKMQWDQALGIDMPLINNGIDMDLWSVRTSEDRAYLLWSARINKDKNVAAAICVAKHLRLPLRIAGRIVDQQYFDQQVKPHLNDQIQYVGHLSQLQLSSLAKNASAYLATATWQEPFGLAALEMLASGVPVVGFHTAVPPDWKHESVLITASLRWQDLSGLIEKSIAVSPATCREFASTMNIQGMSSAYVKLYTDVLAENSVGEN
ncbi:MAG TPA: glycosyltransferase [Dyadobacter sp.]|nr:glycosyltransferase [Dyadobacter sp.]